VDRTYLLSIDGGGIRGIIPATLLVKLERTTGRLARETFSFAAGTSTGAIIAAGIAAGIPAERILDLYLTRAREIFTQSPLNLPRRILLGCMYPIRKLYDVLAEELGPQRDWALNDAPIDLLITAKRVSDGMPWYFVKDKPTNSQCTGRLGLVDTVTASAAAPTFFQPWTVRGNAGAEPVGALVDGGLGVAGNPVYQACVEAFYYDCYQPQSTLVVSLGTGRYLAPQRPIWIWPWFQWILGELLRSPGEQQTEIVQRHFPDLAFYRLDPMLERGIEMDDAGAVHDLHRIGQRFAEQVDWEAILAGTDTTFSVGPTKTQWQQYRHAVGR
jgi:predicted acylesterase/phospholipase RssA